MLYILAIIIGVIGFIFTGIGKAQAKPVFSLFGGLLCLVSALILIINVALIWVS